MRILGSGGWVQDPCFSNLPPCRDHGVLGDQDNTKEAGRGPKATL